MLRSLFSGISGLRSHQTMLDVTGNNIANANTAGFKGSSTVFQETMSQMMAAAAGEDAIRGGNGPLQVGLGVQVAGIAMNLTQGSAQATGRTTDLMIQGDGLFVTRRGGETLYTRAGAFTLDELGTLVTPTGARVMGYSLDAAGNATGEPRAVDLSTRSAVPPIPAPADGEPPVELVSYNIGTDGRVRGIFSDGVQRDLCQIAIANFQNPAGLEKVGETSFRASANSGEAEVGVPLQGGRGSIMAGALEMSNVDLAAEFTNLILAQRGFQANSRVITTSDQVLEELVNIKR